MKIYRSSTPVPHLISRLCRHLLLILLLAGSLHASAQDSVTLTGTVKGLDKGMIYFSWQGDGAIYFQDSCILHDGQFSFKAPLKDPVMAQISSARDIRSWSDPHWGSLYLEPGRMQLTATAGDFKHLQITGSPVNDEYKTLMDREAPVLKEEAPISEAYDKANNTYIKYIRAKAPDPVLDSLKNIAQNLHEKLDSYGEKIETIEMDHIHTHPDSYVSANLLYRHATGLPLVDLKKDYDSFSDKIKNSHYGEDLRSAIKDLQQGSPGSPASMFSTKDIEGQPFNLADLKGNKYVLVDFWASWCVPCRRSIPHLLTLYGKYKDKGLEIVGVSDDDHDTAAWKKAVAQDHSGVWKHVLRGLKMSKDGRYDTSTDISKPYGIHSLPTKILIDKDGMIIGRYGGGGEDDEAMDKKLEEIFHGSPGKS